MRVDIRVGYDGKCGVHRTMPTIFRRTGLDLQFLVDDNDHTIKFVNIIEVHCAAGHKYLAVDLDEGIPDPLDEVATESIVAEES